MASARLRHQIFCHSAVSILLRLSIGYACDAFVLENPHYDSTIFSLSFFRLVFADLVSLSHRPRSKHSRKGDVSLLDQNVCYLVGTVFAELLIQSRAAYGGGETLYLDHISFDGSSLLR